MEDIAPTITRQRLLIEARFTIDVTEETVRNYLFGLSEALQLRVYGEPIIHSPMGEGKEVNQGFDAFIPLIDSGIALYIWSSEKFLSCVLYTCKKFDVQEALQYTREFYKTSKLASREF